MSGRPSGPPASTVVVDHAGPTSRFSSDSSARSRSLAVSGTTAAATSPRKPAQHSPQQSASDSFSAILAAARDNVSAAISPVSAYEQGELDDRQRAERLHNAIAQGMQAQAVGVGGDGNPTAGDLKESEAYGMARWGKQIKPVDAEPAWI